MNILIINGSPKGQYSITLQTCLFVQQKFNQHRFTILNVGQTIKALEKDFTPALRAVNEADMLLFSYPVYTFIVPSQLHRFVELLKEHNVDLKGKWATQISTSKHFYDITAHRFIRENALDLGLKYIDGLSADMDDLLTEKGRSEAIGFFNLVMWSVEHDFYAVPQQVELTPCRKVDVLQPTTKLSGKRVVVVTDLLPDDEQLKSLIERFCNVFPYETDIFNIRKFAFGGGCLSCFNCSTDGKCIYKDGFDDYLRSNIQKHDAIVSAFNIRDHSMGSRFKMYDDRQFCNGHRTVTMGMPFGYIVSGNYSKEPNLQMIIEGRAEVGGNFLAGVATDEFDPNKAIDQMSQQLTYALDNHYTRPSNFLGVGGMKIFRDLIYLMRGMMRADHKFFKAHNQYDFPQKKRGTALKMYLVGMLIGNPKIKAKMGNKMNEGMIAPYKKVLEKK